MKRQPPCSLSFREDVIQYGLRWRGGRSIAPAPSVDHYAVRKDISDTPWAKCAQVWR